MGYSPWGHKESDMTEGLTLSLSFPFHFLSMPGECGTGSQEGRL